jgi:hypothetical protein
VPLDRVLGIRGSKMIQRARRDQALRRAASLLAPQCSGAWEVSLELCEKLARVCMSGWRQPAQASELEEAIADAVRANEIAQTRMPAPRRMHDIIAPALTTEKFFDGNCSAPAASMEA